MIYYYILLSVENEIDNQFHKSQQMSFLIAYNYAVVVHNWDTFGQQ